MPRASARLRSSPLRAKRVDICKKYGDEAEDLLTAMHEIIGHGSGKLDPKLTHEPAYYLKEYFSDAGRSAGRSDGAVERVGPQAEGAWA